VRDERFHYSILKYTILTAYVTYCNCCLKRVHWAILSASQAAVGAVLEGYTRKVNQLQVSLGNAAYSISFQRYIASGGNRSIDATSFTNTDELLRHLQAVYNIEYLTIVNTTKHIMHSVNADRQGEVFNSEGVATAAETSGTDVGGGGVAVWTSGLLTYDELLAENPGVFRDRCAHAYVDISTCFLIITLCLTRKAVAVQCMQ
jgi:hypothetical protein